MNSWISACLTVCLLGAVGCTPSRHIEQASVDALKELPAERFELQLQESSAGSQFVVQVESKPTGFAERIATPLGESVWNSIRSCPSVQQKLESSKDGIIVSFFLKNGEVILSADDAQEATLQSSTSCVLRNLRAGKFPWLKQPVVSTLRILLTPKTPDSKTS